MIILNILNGGVYLNLNIWYEKGLTPHEYKLTLTNHSEAFSHIYSNFEIPEAETDFLDSLRKKNLRVLILAQEFCGHCMLDLPIMFRIAEATDMPVKVLIRDENLELMDQYLTHDKRVIPIFIFINEFGNQVAKWGPAAPEINAFTNQLKDSLPDKESPDYEAAFKQLITQVGATFRDNSSYWNYVYNDIKNALEV